MHYNLPGTIIPLQGCQSLQLVDPNKLSDIDISGIRYLYKCGPLLPFVPPTKPTSSISALDIPDSAFNYWQNSVNKKHVLTRINSTRWTEENDSKVSFTFTLLSQTGNVVILEDRSRSMFVQLMCGAFSWGSTKSTAGQNVLASGNWINPELTHPQSCLCPVTRSRKPFFWQKSGNKKHFFRRRSSGKWAEEVDFEVKFNFDHLSQTGNDVILVDKSRNMYLRLSCGKVTWGNSLAGVSNNQLYNGFWVNPNGMDWVNLC